MVLVIEALDGRLCLGLIAHLHEAEALAAARVAVLDDLRALNLSECGEQNLQVGAADLIRQVPDIQLLAHHQSPERKPATRFSLSGSDVKGASMAAQQVGKTRKERERISRGKSVANSFSISNQS